MRLYIPFHGGHLQFGRPEKHHPPPASIRLIYVILPRNSLNTIFFFCGFSPSLNPPLFQVLFRSSKKGMIYVRKFEIYERRLTLTTRKSFTVTSREMLGTSLRQRKLRNSSAILAVGRGAGYDPFRLCARLRGEARLGLLDGYRGAQSEDLGNPAEKAAVRKETNNKNHNFLTYY